MSAADKLISLGLTDAGYTYLNIDDCWHTRTRAADGSLTADPAKFPSGMAAVGAALHAKGLSFGIYSDAGLFTCAGYPGSRFHEMADAALFASWGVDYLKYDNCFASSADVQQRYTDMRDALNKTGRPIYFSMCNWGVAEPWHWGPQVGNSWRTDQDIAASWDSILRSLDNGAAGLAQYAGPGGWNDPDMLEVGNGGLSVAQQRSHFALWALVKAPLLIGANLDTISRTSLDILMATEVIAINQDTLGVAGDIIWKEGPLEVWAAPLVHNQRAVVLFNRHHYGQPMPIRVTWAQLGYRQPGGDGSGGAGEGLRASVRELFAGKDLGEFEEGFETAVDNYDVAVLRVTPAVAQPTSSGGSSSWLQRLVAQLCRLACRALPQQWGLLQHSKQCGQQLGQTAAAAARAEAAAAAAAVAPLAAVEGGHTHTSSHLHGDDSWRPWHDAAAAQLQAAVRAKATAARAAVRREQQQMRAKERQHLRPRPTRTAAARTATI